MRTIKKVESIEVKHLIDEFSKRSAHVFFDTDQFKKRISPLGRMEINTLFIYLFENSIEDKEARSILYYIINSCDRVMGRILSNIVIKRIIVIGNQYYLSEFVKDVDISKIKLLSTKNKTALWQAVESTLKRLEFYTTNDLIGSLYSSSCKIPIKYQVPIFRQIVNVADSSANSKNTAKSILTNLNIRIKDRVFKDVFFPENEIDYSKAVICLECIGSSNSRKLENIKEIIYDKYKKLRTG